MSQPLPTSISYTKLEIATYIHELADKLLPSTTSQHILLGTTQLAPNTTLYYKACKNYFPVLLCTTKLAQSTSQYYFVLQSLHCTRSFPVYYNLQLQNRISTPQQKKKTICKHFEKGFVQGKLLAPNLRKSADKSLLQPGCSHSNTIYEIQLQKTIVLRRQSRHQATLMQPLQCDLRRMTCKA